MDEPIKKAQLGKLRLKKENYGSQFWLPRRRDSRDKKGGCSYGRVVDGANKPGRARTVRCREVIGDHCSGTIQPVRAKEYCPEKKTVQNMQIKRIIESTIKVSFEA